MSDENEILKLIAEYCHAIDERGGAGLSELFTDEARFTHQGSTTTGGQAIEARFLGSVSSGPRGLIHLSSNPIIEVSGEEAVGTVDHVLFRRQDDGAFQVMAIGRWVDRYARVGGKWQFSERSVQMPYNASNAM